MLNERKLMSTGKEIYKKERKVEIVVKDSFTL